MRFHEPDFIGVYRIIIGVIACVLQLCAEMMVNFLCHLLWHPLEKWYLPQMPHSLQKQQKKH